MLLKPAKALIAAAVVIVVAVAGVAADATHERSNLRNRAAAITGGDPRAGEAKFIGYGCGGCHMLENVRKATGMVGPPLDGVALRAVIAGRLANKPDNLEAWIHNPQAISPGTAMPVLGVSQGDARDIAAFLYTRT
jgi:cytochrome c2